MTERRAKGMTPAIGSASHPELYITENQLKYYSILGRRVTWTLGHAKMSAGTFQLRHMGRRRFRAFIRREAHRLSYGTQEHE